MKSTAFISTAAGGAYALLFTGIYLSTGWPGPWVGPAIGVAIAVGLFAGLSYARRSSDT